MHTTTVRFDDETWDRLKLRAADMGIATADYIRIAAVQRLERSTYERRLLALEAQVAAIARVIHWLLRRFGASR